MSRILIVDDDESILKALRRLLSLTPCTVGEVTCKLVVDIFSSPEAALEKARHTAYDLVLSDYRMPGMNGVQLLKALREIQPDAARLILSGYADLNGLIDAINEAGINRSSPNPGTTANWWQPLARCWHCVNWCWRTSDWPIRRG